MTKHRPATPDLALRAVRAYARVLDAAAAIRVNLWDDRGLTTVQVRALFTILRHGPLHTSELARRLHVRPATMTGIADRLVRHGLVQRLHEPDDRRVVTLALTEQGCTVLREAEAQLQAQMSGLLARYGAERAETFVELLEELARLASTMQPEREDSATPAGEPARP